MSVPVGAGNDRRSTPFDWLVKQGWTMIAPDGSVWGAPLPGWVCDKCGQALTGALDECNSGIHVGPDGKNKGHAVRAGGGHTADSETVRQELKRPHDPEAVAALKRLEAAANRTDEVEARLASVGGYEGYSDAWERLERRAEAAEAERDRLQHIIDCAETPLMRDVLAERDAALAALRGLVEWANGAGRDDFGDKEWAAARFVDQQHAS